MWVTLIPVANRPECANALDIAFDLTAKLKGCVIGAHIRAHRDSDAALPSEDMRLASDAEIEAQWAKTESSGQYQDVDASTLFTQKAAAAGFAVQSKSRTNAKPQDAYWQERVGTPQFIMPIIGPASDMVVVSRPARKESNKARVFMLEALMNSHRPVLILPREAPAPTFDHVAVGWNSSPEAARAVHACLPVLQAAKKVSLVTIGNEHGLGPSGRELTTYLSHHGIEAVSAHRQGRGGSAELADVVKEIGADTLVMGAYSQARWRERLFGGASQYMLTETDIPLLMMHS